jgi:hypothetical protein
LGENEVSDPWAFGWTQVLTIIGFAISIGISIAGLRTFGKWKREKIEEKKLDIALEALSIAYEAQMIFEDIQRPFVSAYEWADMPTEGMTEKEKDRRRSLYAIINRLQRHIGFFERVLSLQPKFMAVFGRESDAVFMKLHRSRNGIQAAIDVMMLMNNPGPEDAELMAQMRSDIWNTKGPGVKEPEKTKKLVAEFRDDIERICTPLVNRELTKEATKKA